MLRHVVRCALSLGVQVVSGRLARRPPRESELKRASKHRKRELEPQEECFTEATEGLPRRQDPLPSRPSPARGALGPLLQLSSGERAAWRRACPQDVGHGRWCRESGMLRGAPSQGFAGVILEVTLEVILEAGGSGRLAGAGASGPGSR